MGKHMTTYARNHLCHTPPLWLNPAEHWYFITQCTLPRGKPALTNPQIADALLETVRYRITQGVWYIQIFLIMPDHIHALIVALNDLNATLRAWKHWTARSLKIEWQRDFFEHRIRDEKALAEKALYIERNPVRKGLVSTPEDWPYVIRSY
jgi:putative transposase